MKLDVFLFSGYSVNEYSAEYQVSIKHDAGVLSWLDSNSELLVIVVHGIGTSWFQLVVLIPYKISDHFVFVAGVTRLLSWASNVYDVISKGG